MKKHVLVVDDDRDLVQAIKAVLEANGFEVSAAHNGTGALVAISARKPDLIVLDVMMDSDTEGFGVAYKLESDAATRRIPVVLLSGFVDHLAAKPDVFAFITDRGWPAVKLMRKPVAMAELLTTIRELLAEAEALKSAVA